MNNKQLKTKARKMLSNIEKEKRTPIFLSNAWLLYKKNIQEKVKNKLEKVKKRKIERLAKQVKEKKELTTKQKKKLSKIEQKIIIKKAKRQKYGKR